MELIGGMTIDNPKAISTTTPVSVAPTHGVPGWYQMPVVFTLNRSKSSRRTHSPTDLQELSLRRVVIVFSLLVVNAHVI
jgi:hypothetical protein